MREETAGVGVSTGVDIDRKGRDGLGRGDFDGGDLLTVILLAPRIGRDDDGGDVVAVAGFDLASGLIDWRNNLRQRIDDAFDVYTPCKGKFFL